MCIVRNRETGEYLPRELSPRVDNSEEFLINAGELYSSIVTTVKKSRDLDLMRGQKIVKLTKKYIFMKEISIKSN